MRLEIEGQEPLNVSISFVDDPFKSMLTFLKGIIEPDKFIPSPNWGMYEDVPEILFKQEPSPDGNPELFRLIVHDDIEDVSPTRVYVDVILNRKEFVREYASKLLKFIETEYDARKWIGGKIFENDVTDLHTLKPELINIIKSCNIPA